MIDELHDLFRHMAWADGRVWSAILATPSTEGDALLREKLWHIHLVQRAFLSIWSGTAPDYRELSTFPDLRALQQWGRTYHDEVRPFLGTLEEPALGQPVRLPWAAQLAATFGKDAADPTLRETLLQVAMHSTYHRGQVNTRLRELGGDPPLVDYIAWIWISRPTAEWA